jgi:hypothetical protein
MKKFYFLLLCIFFSTNISAQTVFINDSSEVTFYSYAPLEDIKATSRQMNSILNTVTGELAFMIPMRSFRFPKALMQEHFNEKYMESEKYPHATFKGKVNEKIDFSKPGTYNLTATGKITIHGKEKEITEIGVLEIETQKISLTSEFHVALEDFNITKPQIMFNNIADTIDVKMKVNYVPYKKK